MKDFFYNTCSTLFIACLFIYFGGVLINQEKNIRIIEEKTKVQEELLAECEKRTLELTEEKNTIGTPEYVEEYGRKNGLVWPWETKLVINN